MNSFFKDKEKGGNVYVYLVFLSVATTLAFQAWRALFNNFAVEAASATSFEIGLIQSIREIPGFLSLLVIYILLFINELKLALISAIVVTIGVAFTGFFPFTFGLALTTLFMSTGFHYFETASTSLSLQHFSKKDAPFLLASIKKYAAFASVLSAGLVWAASYFFSYQMNYLFFGLISLALIIYVMINFSSHVEDKVVQHKKMIWRKKYWLFYFLTFLSGARRQIFVVFSIFLMVKKFNFSAGDVALLYLLNNIVNIFLLPAMAKLIDKFGEKKVLTLEYFILVPLFVAYAYAASGWVVVVLFIIDNVVYSFVIALKTYFQKIAGPADIAPTNAVSFTINHIAAVFIPFVGGVLWQYSSKIPFLFGAVLGLVSLVMSQLIVIPDDAKSI